MSATLDPNRGACPRCGGVYGHDAECAQEGRWASLDAPLGDPELGAALAELQRATAARDVARDRVWQLLCDRP